MSTPAEEKISRYESLLQEMWTTSAQYLGAFSVKLLVERVAWEISQNYKEMELLYFDENGISCAEIANAVKINPDIPIDDMFMKFISKYVEILARLLGYEQTNKIARKLKEEFPNFPIDLKEE